MKLTVVLDEFMAMEAEIVMIDPIEEGYKSARSLYGLVHYGIKRGGYPFKVSTNKGKVYLKKNLKLATDAEET